MRWYRLAAEQGNTSAQLNLGAMDASGGAIPKDLIEAYAWRSIAAAQGNAIAKENKAKLVKQMSYEQIAKAQKRSREYWARHVVLFQQTPAIRACDVDLEAAEVRIATLKCRNEHGRAVPVPEDLVKLWISCTVYEPLRAPHGGVRERSGPSAAGARTGK